MKPNSPNKFIRLALLLAVFLSVKMQAQQDPQYTQYMFNTMSVNPAYAGSKDHSVFNFLARKQWIKIEGAPQTQTFSYDTQIKHSGVGIGLNAINDEVGPAQETYVDANLSYALQVNDYSFLALGLKLGTRVLNIDWSKGKHREQDDVFEENIVNKFMPTLGIGAYYYTDQYYIGASISNVLETKHYNANKEYVATEESHLFLIAGYVFDLNRELKFKPTVLAKGAMNTPLSVDVSANFLYQEKFSGGVSYRWNDSVSAMLGFQVTENLNIGYAYDLTTSNFRNYNSGSHELMLRYEILNGAMRSPRFF